jgi:hypothetical protein
MKYNAFLQDSILKKLILASAVFMGLLISILVFNPSKAHATLNLNPDPGTAIPTWVRDYSRNCDSGTQSPSFDDWISATGSLTQTSVDVDYGTTSIGLVYAMASVVCKPNSAVTENNQLFTGASPGVNNIVGKEYRIDYRSGPGDYNIPGTYEGAIVGFDYAPAGGFTSSGLYTVTLYSVAINDFTDGQFLCIGARKAGMPNPTNARDYDKCEPEPTDFSIYVNVKGGPPGGQTFVTCDGGFRGIAYDGDDLSASLAVAIILDIGKPSERIINLTANEAIPTPEFNVAALAAFGVTGAKGFTEAIPPEYKDGYAHTYIVIAGNIPAGQEPKRLNIGEGNIVCPKSASLDATGNVELDDDESPTNVTFSGVGAKTTTTNRTVKGVDVSQAYVIRRQGSATDEAFSPAANPPSRLGTVDSNGFVGPGGTTFPSATHPVAGLNLGDQVCVVVTITPGSAEIDNGNNIVVAGLTKQSRICDRVTNKPYVSFYGNDVLVGRGFANSVGACSDSTVASGYSVRAYNRRNTGGSYQGSSVQLAINALEKIEGVVSEGVRADPDPKILSFANNDSALTFGGEFGTSPRCIRNYFEAAVDPDPDGPNNADNELDSMAFANNQTRYYDTALTINRATPIPKGAKWTIYVKGDVVIQNNLVYDTSWTSKADIPALYLIVEGNISISSNVTQLDGVYVAQPSAANFANTGIINTCTKLDGGSYAINTAELYNNCLARPLTIYGSFAAQRILLNRVADSVRNAGVNEGYNSTRAAERFIFSPEAMLVEPNLPPDTEDLGGVDYMTTLQPIL